MLGISTRPFTLRATRLQSLLELRAAALGSPTISAWSLLVSAFIEHVFGWHVHIHIDGYKLLCYGLKKGVHKRGI